MKVKEDDIPTVLLKEEKGLKREKCFDRCHGNEIRLVHVQEKGLKQKCYVNCHGNDIHLVHLLLTIDSIAFKLCKHYGNTLVYSKANSLTWQF